MVELYPIPASKQLRHGILEDYHNVDFDGFPLVDKEGKPVPERQRVYNEVMEYALHLDNARKEGISLWLYGSNGVGN